jgi:hypothetical protein
MEIDDLQSFTEKLGAWEMSETALMLSKPWHGSVGDEPWSPRRLIDAIWLRPYDFSEQDCAKVRPG